MVVEADGPSLEFDMTASSQSSRQTRLRIAERIRVVKEVFTQRNGRVCVKGRLQPRSNLA